MKNQKIFIVLKIFLHFLLNSNIFQYQHTMGNLKQYTTKIMQNKRQIIVLLNQLKKYIEIN